MSQTSKSPRRVAQVALHIGQCALPTYAHRFSPKTYTQPQLFACRVLKQLWKTNYRGAMVRLQDNPTLQQDLGLQRVPHFTTLQKASRRLLHLQRVGALIRRTLRAATPRRTVAVAAIDSTGFGQTNRSPHCAAAMKRYDEKSLENKGKTLARRGFTKLGLLVDTTTHMIHALHTGMGPQPDVDELQPLLKRCLARRSIGVLVADAGYDSEANHQYLRDQLKVRSVIPAKAGRRSDKLPRGRYRRLMRQRFAKKTYRHRVQVETVMSMIKRNLDHFTRARKQITRQHEVAIKALTHNIMILQRVMGGFLHSLSISVCPIRRATTPTSLTPTRIGTIVFALPCWNGVCICCPRGGGMSVPVIRTGN